MTSADHTADQDCDDAFTAGKSAARNRMLLNVVGSLTVLTGLLALFVAFLGPMNTNFGMGWVLIVSGGIGLLTAFRRDKARHLTGAFVLSIVSAIVGLLMLMLPVADFIALAGLFVGYFAASGALRVVFGLGVWGNGGAAMIIFGAVALGVAWLLWTNPPADAVWLPSALVSLDLLMWGAMLLEFAGRQSDVLRQT